MRLVVLYGPPGVGKLTVGTALSELTGFKLFLNHLTVNLVTSVFPPGSMRVRLHCLQRSPPHRQDLRFILRPVRITNPSV
jgi:hypothetical protein